MRKDITSTMPRCPNHGELLEGLPSPLPEKGEGMCPVSGAYFAFEAVPNQYGYTKDSSGNVVKVPIWSVSGDDSDKLGDTIISQ